MRVFVTGGTEFVGRHVVERLRASGHDITCLARRPDHPAATRLQGARTRLVRGDVLDPSAVIRGMADSDAVIHAAGLYSLWEPDTRAYWRVNVEGTRNVMEAALQTGVGKVVHIGSIVTYGRQAVVPFTEAATPGRLASEYARSKAAGEELAWNRHRTRGLPLVVVSPASVLGAGDPKASGQYITNLVQRRLPARAAERGRFTFVHVRDVADAIVRATEQRGNIGQRYLVGREVLSFREMNDLVARTAGAPVPALALPDTVALVTARLLTAVADRIKRSPLWGFSVDQVRTMLDGSEADGSKAERELGLQYTPIGLAIQEMVAEVQSGRSMSRAESAPAQVSR
ncbi:MAG: SDR family NAD(P)-dependent oxidoreductase [Chloroflexi bacterium]|nr:SDR family NAD(P)-dependent oxidoreductase [Chloroflexota bacterium]